MEDDLGEQLQLCCHALSDHGDGAGIVYLKIQLLILAVSVLFLFIILKFILFFYFSPYKRKAAVVSGLRVWRKRVSLGTLGCA